MGSTERPKDPKDARADDEPEERPTVIPKFDPADLAKRTAESQRTPARRTTPLGVPPVPSEALRGWSQPESAPPESAGPETREMSDSTRSSLLSMADARVPSVTPARTNSFSALSLVERSWDDEDAPPPGDEPPTRPAGKAIEDSQVQRKADGPRAPSAAPPRTGPPPGQVTASSGSIEDTIREMRDRFSLGDYTGALVLAEGLLDDVPHDAEVKDCAESCRNVLRQMYTARIGPLDRVPVVTVARDQLRWLSIDHRAGFVLSHVDGVSSLEMILDVSGMPLLDALRILCELAQQRIISFR